LSRIRLILTLLTLAVPVHAAVPTPASVLGKTPGDDFYLASYDDAVKYLKAAAPATDRMKLFVVGKSTKGVDTYIAVISSPQNLAQLDRQKAIARQLTQARGLTDEAAHALAREAKAIVHIDGGLHSSEVAGGQHSIALAYKLLSAENDAEVNLILDNVILVLWPTLNPDGQNYIVDWYRRNLGTPYEVSPMPWLYQDYVGHDNNRDGYMMNMIEEQVVTRSELDFSPVLFYCQHQSAPSPARIWIPPFSEPISANIHPLMLRWLNVLGTQMAAYLDAHQLPGAIHRARFDNWYAGFMDYTHIFRNEMSFFTETALYRYATPHFYTVEDFPPDTRDLRGDVMYSSPWKGGWWRLGDAVHYMTEASMSVLELAARYRETLLYNKYQAGRDTIERFRKEPPFAYVVPGVQRDVPEAALLAQKMIENGLEVHQTKSAFSANGRDYPAGSWLILMDQPFARLAKELLEVQKYPAADQLDHPPYDVTGWTLPLQMGVEVAPITDPLSEQQRAALERITKAAPPAGVITGTGPVFLLDHKVNASFDAINQAQAAGATVAFAHNKTDDTDAIVISGLAREKMNDIATKLSIPVTAVAKAPAATLALAKPRIALYRPWVASIDEGWTRWILEKYNFPYKNLFNADIRAGHLRERFSVLILPDMNRNALMEGHRTGTVPGEYVGGLGDPGLDAIREFVNDGGTLVAFNQSATAIADLLKLPVRNVLAGLKPTEFNGPGSLLKVELKSFDQPATFGMSHEPTVMFERGPAFETTAAFKGAVLASYPTNREPLASGYLLHGDRIQGKHAALQLTYGKGQIYLYGFKPQWRAQSHNTYKLFFNVLYDVKAQAAITPSTTQSPEAQRWAALMEGAHTDLPKLIEANKAFTAARGAKALDESTKLNEAIKQFQDTRLAAIHDFQEQASTPAIGRLVAQYAAQWRTLLADAKTKDLSEGDAAERYRLPKLEKDVTEAIK
jgi:hypothetical protein